MTQTPTRPSRATAIEPRVGRSTPRWLVPTGLILLSLIPIMAGATRLRSLIAGDVAPDSARFFDSPVPVVVHIVSVTIFCILGAFQFVPSWRIAKPGSGRSSWHRMSGRILIPAGILAALSGLWMAVFYNLPATDGDALRVLRLIFGSAMVVSIVLAVRAVLRRDYRRHSAWITRAYAIGLGAGTQALIILPVILTVGYQGQTIHAVLMGAAWVINLAIAEYVIWRRRSSSRRLSPAPRAKPLPRSYHELMIAFLRSIWMAPRATPAPPRRVWRDWALIGVLAPLMILEGILRTELPWPLLSVTVGLCLLPTILWRRTRPFTMLTIVYVGMTLVELVTGASPELFSAAYPLLIVYGTTRWGSGRASLAALAIVITGVAISEFRGFPITADAMGGLGVGLSTLGLGLIFRLRASARARELDRVKLLEREGLARDLHDTVAHHVSAIVIRAQAGLATSASHVDAATDALRIIEAEASSTLAEMRSMVRLLRRDTDIELEPTPSIADIERLAGRQPTGADVDVRLVGEVDEIPPTVAAAIYRLSARVDYECAQARARREARRGTRRLQ